MWTLISLLACSEAPPEGTPVTVLERQDDGSYALEARVIDGLTDPIHASGDYITATRGGSLTNNGFTAGAPTTVDAVLQDGVLVPLDEDGLILWSFEAHLTDARQSLLDKGVDVTTIFPVTASYNPASSMDLLGVENAAYVTSERAFVLFPDALNGVPVAANTGVVFHEFGHGLFELCTSEEVGGTIPYGDEPVEVIDGVRALNEGFADTIATLSLDDPRFIDASIVLAERDVTRDVTTDDVTMPLPQSQRGTGYQYDPYAYGTVFAAFAWDVREATDPDTALLLAVDALTEWGDSAEWADPQQYVVHYIDAADGDARTAACDSAAIRFPSLETGC